MSAPLPRSLVLSSALSSELNFHNLSAPFRQVASGKSTKGRTFLRKGIARLRFTNHSFASVINQYFLVLSINILFNIYADAVTPSSNTRSYTLWSYHRPPDGHFLFHLDTVLVVPFAREGEEEGGVVPDQQTEPVLVAEGQFHLVPDKHLLSGTWKTSILHQVNEICLTNIWIWQNGTTGF